MRPAAALCVLAAAAAPIGATWSIVVMDRVTGELAIASATCLTDVDLKASVPIVVVGKGVAATQASGLGPAIKKKVKQGIAAGMHPHQIVQKVEDNGSTANQQLGVVTAAGTPVSFSGTSVCPGLANVVGSHGSMVYAIQGNLLVGEEPVLAAEQALVTTPGDLGQRVMAAMQAARELGGDGRCSCELYQPGGACGNPGGTACGAPPAGFDPELDKSAHVGFVIVARMGDKNAPCGGGDCANGDYYLKLNVIGDEDDPDPVETLQILYDQWRADLAGRPDGLLSVATPHQGQLFADGESTLRVDLRLVDVEGEPLTQGGAQVTLGSSSVRPPFSALADVLDHGDGSYTLILRAGTKPGTDELRIQVEDGQGPLVTLFPFLDVEVLPVPELAFATPTLRASGPGTAAARIDAGNAAAAQPFALLASASGTSPGQPLGAGLRLPLNPDPLFELSRRWSGGRLDGRGRARATLRFPPEVLVPWVGLSLDWAVMRLDEARGELSVSPVVSLQVVP